MPKVLDIETGTRPRDGPNVSSRSTDISFQFRTPSVPLTVGQARQQKKTDRSSTARLPRVSTQFLTSGGQEDGFEGAESINFGEGQNHSGGQDMRAAPPTSVSQLCKFVKDDAVPDSDMLDGHITLRKENYGAPGS